MISLLTSFDGRINRKSYWMGALLIFFVFFAAAMAILKIFGLAVYSGPYSGDSALSLVFAALVLFVSIPLMVKRLHDRNKSGHYVWPVCILELLWLAGDFSGITGNTEGSNTLGLSLAAAYLIVTLWMLVELGFLRGTSGPNRFGADPLDQQTTARDRLLTPSSDAR